MLSRGPPGTGASIATCPKIARWDDWPNSRKSSVLSAFYRPYYRLTSTQNTVLLYAGLCTNPCKSAATMCVSGRSWIKGRKFPVEQALPRTHGFSAARRRVDRQRRVDVHQHLELDNAGRTRRGAWRRNGATNLLSARRFGTHLSGSRRNEDHLLD